MSAWDNYGWGVLGDDIKLEDDTKLGDDIEFKDIIQLEDDILVEDDTEYSNTEDEQRDFNRGYNMEYHKDQHKDTHKDQDMNLFSEYTRDYTNDYVADSSKERKNKRPYYVGNESDGSYRDINCDNGGASRPSKCIKDEVESRTEINHADYKKMEKRVVESSMMSKIYLDTASRNRRSYLEMLYDFEEFKTTTKNKEAMVEKKHFEEFESYKKMKLDHVKALGKTYDDRLDSWKEKFKKALLDIGLSKDNVGLAHARQVHSLEKTAKTYTTIVKTQKDTISHIKAMNQLQVKAMEDMKTCGDLRNLIIETMQSNGIDHTEKIRVELDTLRFIMETGEDPFNGNVVCPISKTPLLRNDSVVVFMGPCGCNKMVKSSVSRHSVDAFNSGEDVRCMECSLPCDKLLYSTTAKATIDIQWCKLEKQTGCGDFESVCQRSCSINEAKISEQKAKDKASILANI